MMDIQLLSGTVRQLIGDAHTGKAITALIEFLKTDNRYNNLHGLAIQVQAEFSRLRSDEIGGVLSEEQSALAYNRIHRKVLGLLEKVEQQDLDAADELPARGGGLKKIWMSAGIGIVAIVIIVLYLSTNRQDEGQAGQDIPAEAVSATSCPPLEVPDGFNVLVANFIKLRGPDARPEVEIVREINALCKKHGLKAGAVLSDTDQITTSAQAERTSRSCKTQLVVYGTYETIHQDSVAININYKLLTDMKLSTLQSEGESGFKAVQTISSIDAEGELLSGITSVIKGIFGIVAKSNNDVALAAPFLGQAAAANLSSTDTTLSKLAADCYVATDQTDKALKQYDIFFSKGGESVVARNNRAVLNLKKGNYEAAIRDADVNIAANKTDTIALMLRTEANTKMQRWDEANKDLEVLQQIKPNDKVIAKKSVEVKEKLQTSSSTQTIKVNPTYKKIQPQSGG